MGRRYTSVTEMVREVTGDKDYAQELEQELGAKSLSRTLFVLRCQKGVTQADLAKRLGWSQSRVSKLENSELDKMKMGDLVAYIGAIDLQACLCFHKKRMTAVEWVKFHAFEVKKHLDRLAGLAHEDEGIYEGVKSFFGEALFNLLHMFENSAKKLPKPCRKPASTTLEVCVSSDAISDSVDSALESMEISAK